MVARMDEPLDGARPARSLALLIFFGLLGERYGTAEKKRGNYNKCRLEGAYFP
jgi:hypothetical protein